MDLRTRIQDKIRELGPEEAAKFFGFSKRSVHAWAKDGGPKWIGAAQRIIDSVMPELAALDRANDALWEGKSVQMGLPCYQDMEPATHFTLLANYARYGPDKIGLLQEEGTCIWRQRSVIAKRFLETESKELVMVDSDMVLPTGRTAQFDFFGDREGRLWPRDLAAVAALPRIMSHPAETGVIGGIYRDRKGAHKMMVSDAVGSPAINASYDRYEFRGMRKVDWVATGFMRIPRWVLEKLIAEAPKLWPDIVPDKPTGHYGLFEPFKGARGEDVAFCLRCKQVGIPVWADCNIFPKHVGKSFN